MTLTNVGLQQLSNQAIEAVWVSDQTPVGGFTVEQSVNGAAFTLRATVNGESRSYTDTVTGLTVGDDVTYRITDVDTPVDTGDGILTWVDSDTAYTYGNVDYLASAIRYGNLDTVKGRLGIDVADTSWDTDLTQAIVSAEVAMDLYWGRSFPDTGDNPEIPGIPVQVRQAAENVAVAVFKQTDAPFGTAGSDAFSMGELDFDDLARREIHRSPLLRGFRRGWGVS